MQGFIIAGVAVSGFFIIFILSKKNRKRADLLLILINLFMIGFLALDVLIRERITPTLFFLQALLPFFLFPVFLLFALETLGKKWNTLWLVLFVPASIATLYISADLYFLHDYSEPELLKLYNFPPLAHHVLYKSNQILFIASLIWLIRKLREYRRNIKENYSYIDPISLRWLSRFSWIYLSITFISLTVFVISNLHIFPIDIQTAYSIVSACAVLTIFYLSFHGIRQYSVTEYYTKLQPVEENTFEIPESKEKYKASSLTGRELESIYNQLLKLFEDKAVYCEPKLQLQDVADALSVTSHTLSQTINTLAGQPFYDFVNGYRVTKLQRLLEDPAKKRFTILALGMDSGFNSKASLNRVFKEHTGLSPSEYQRRHFHN